MRKMVLYLILILISISGYAGSDSLKFKIKYLSLDFVYLDGGKEQGLSVGDRLTVRKDGQKIAELEVVFTAQHSASCKIVRQTGAILQGDWAFSEKTEKEKEISATAEITSGNDRKPDSLSTPVFFTRRKSAEKSTGANRNHSETRVTGRMAVQYYFLDDRGAANLDFRQPALRLNFRAQNLWGRDYQFRVRTRTRYNSRTRAYSSGVPQTEWRNRIYEFSFSYEKKDTPFNFRLGRILSNHYSGAGYIDGLAIQYNISSHWHAEVFAGSQPEWQYSKYQNSLKKYGFFLGFETGSYRQRRWESTLAAAGEYHGAMISREFLFLRNSLNLGSRFSFYQSADIDINRNWRRDKTGENLSLTNLYISARYRFSQWLSGGFNYDYRKNYWSYEIRSMVDSLFDDALRRGVRANIAVRLSKSWQLFGNAGFRERTPGGKPVWSFSGGMNHNNFILTRMFIHGQYSGFTGAFADGNHVTLRWGKYFGGNSIALVSGRYAYYQPATGLERVNRWVGITGLFYLPGRFYLSGEYRLDAGADTDGRQYFMELGYHL